MKFIRWLNVILPACGMIVSAASGRYDAALWAAFGAIMATIVALMHERAR